MSPIPFHCGMMKFVFERNRSGLNRLNPLFILSLELFNGDLVPLLYARKEKFSKNSVFLISSEKSLNQKN
jgi:hypothetical protein